MELVLIAAMATACVLTAVETLVRPLGKWRGLLGITAAFGACLTLDVSLPYLAVYGLAATFGGLSLSVLVEQGLTPTSNLPPRIPPR